MSRLRRNIGLTLVAACLMARPALGAEDPEAIVQQQVEAYNRGDLDAFVNLYAEDVELYDLGPSVKPTLQGRSALKAEYGPLFTKYAPKAAIVSRIKNGDFVIDQERVTAQGHTHDGVAIYQVEAGKIRRVWFTP